MMSTHENVCSKETMLTELKNYKHQAMTMQSIQGKKDIWDLIELENNSTTNNINDNKEKGVRIEDITAISVVVDV